MAKMQTITCACGCGRTKEVRTADVKRGWGKYFNKSCKANHQMKTQGRKSSRSDNLLSGYEADCKNYDDMTHPFSDDALGQS